MVFLKSKPVFCIQKDIQLSTIAQVKDQMVKKLKGILKNQQTALGQGNVTLTLFFLLFNFDGKSLPTVILADKVIQEWWISSSKGYSALYSAMSTVYSALYSALFYDLFHRHIQRRYNWWLSPALLDINSFVKWVSGEIFLLDGEVWPNYNFMKLFLRHKKAVLVWHKWMRLC